MGSAARLWFIDLLRVVACQAIVLHHLANYGPLPDAARELLPNLSELLVRHGRLFVQVFFVIGGYLTARSLEHKQTFGGSDFLTTTVGRYRRIGLPFLAALVLAIVANEVARHWMDDPAISGTPTWGQLLAHVFLIHDLLGYEPLAAGIWYIAIDLQLVIVVALVHWVTFRLAGTASGARLARTVMGALGLASMFWWNRAAELDKFAIYFLGSYSLGLLVRWFEAGLLSGVYLGGYLGLVGLALTLDFRSRLLLATITAITLLMAHRYGAIRTSPRLHHIARWGTASYSIYLTHFPVILIINAWWSAHLPHEPWNSLAGMTVAYLLSVLVGIGFYHGVERKLMALGAARAASARAREGGLENPSLQQHASRF